MQLHSLQELTIILKKNYMKPPLKVCLHTCLWSSSSNSLSNFTYNKKDKITRSRCTNGSRKYHFVLAENQFLYWFQRKRTHCHNSAEQFLFFCKRNICLYYTYYYSVVSRILVFQNYVESALKIIFLQKN